ncbi:MAG: hypothetical protein ABI680_01100 [Chthoniobacteraceae bacterium]
MTEQTELFPTPLDFHPKAEIAAPRVWIREVRMLRTFAPGDEIRRITLQPGLNILWARPRSRAQPARLRARGLSGHATGKTTFCRFVRHLLGEPNFGTDEQRARLRHTFPEAWVVGEVHLASGPGGADEPWVVARPFKTGAHPFVLRGQMLDAMFSDASLRLPLTDYLAALDRVLIEPLPVASFATTPTVIGWPHLLQWLARDQECRFSGLADLRHPSSDHESPGMTVEDCHFLFRGVAGLVDVKEQGELETNRALLVKKQAAEKRAPLLRFRSDSSIKRLRDALADFRPDLRAKEHDELFLAAVASADEAAVATLEKERREMPVPEPLRQARTRMAQAEAAQTRAKENVTAVETSLRVIEQQMKLARKETTPGEFKAWLRENVKDERYCQQPLSAAIEWDCPLNRTSRLPAETKTAPLPTEQTLEDLDRRKGTETQRLNATKLALADAARAIEALKPALETATEAFDAARAKLSDRSSALRARGAEATRAIADAKEAEELEDSIKDHETKIEQSQKRQAALREQQSAALSSFNGTFNRVTRAVLGDDVEGSIRFRGRQIRPTLIHNIDLTSAALETLKIICFDLAALISSVEGQGEHPRFLLHDGPREADMDAELYHRLFLLAVEIQDAHGEAPVNFQYIITTTEPPPATLQETPWLLDPVLDATTGDGKLLGEDF